METTHHRQLDDPSKGKRLHRPGLRAVLREPKMGSRSVVVREVTPEYPPKMPFAEDLTPIIAQDKKHEENSGGCACSGGRTLASARVF